MSVCVLVASCCVPVVGFTGGSRVLFPVRINTVIFTNWSSGGRTVLAELINPQTVSVSKKQLHI